MRSARPPREIPPPLELACLRALWGLHEASVADVRDALVDRKLAYTTVLTLLDRLEKRGAATRRKLGRSFLYAPKAAAGKLRKLAVQNLADDFFGGSKEALLKFLQTEVTNVPRSSAPVPRQSPAKP